jgi:SAM-dependent methyltransferase
MVDPRAYRCPEAGCRRAALIPGDAGLTCTNGHVFPYAPGTRVPVFSPEPDGGGEYALPNAVEVHDNALRWLFATFGTEEALLRERLAARLRLAKGQRLLVTGAGTGNDLPVLAKHLGGEGEMYAQDISRQMILAGEQRHREALERCGVPTHFSIGDAANLPFDDGTFDAAYHFGGINLYADIRRGIAEMARVVRIGGRVLFGDEGVAPWLRHTEFGRMLICNNPLYASDIPLGALPDCAQEVHLSWELSHCFYVIDFVVAAGPPPVDIDVPHAGVRGGTIRTRFYGGLEGVDPDLRDRAYAEAKRLGMSRVEYLEAALRARLAGR